MLIRMFKILVYLREVSENAADVTKATVLCDVRTTKGWFNTTYSVLLSSLVKPAAYLVHGEVFCSCGSKIMLAYIKTCLSPPCF